MTNDEHQHRNKERHQCGEGKNAEGIDMEQRRFVEGKYATLARNNLSKAGFGDKVS